MLSTKVSSTADNHQLDIFLAKVLELELSTPRRDIRSARYFHGKINRVQTETFLDKPGKFLLRESCTQNEQFVLSTNFQGESLHFIVLKTLESDGKVKYSFEGDLFETIRDLVDFHWKSGQPITTTSKAVIYQPVPRTMPLDQPRLIEYYQANIHKTLDQMIAQIFHKKKSLKRLPIIEPTNVFFNEFTKSSEAGVSVIELEPAPPIDLLDKHELHVEGLEGAERWCEIIACHSASVIASHLFADNLKFVGMDVEDKSCESTEILKSGLELMLLPYGHQMRRDVIVRHSCLKYFILTTILKTRSFRGRLEMIVKWIEVASHAKDQFGDYYCFGAIMAALMNETLAELEDVWLELKGQHLDVYHTHEHTHKSLFHKLLKGSQPPSQSVICLPFIIQLCHLLEARFALNTLVFDSDDLETVLKPQNEQQSLLVNTELDDLLDHIAHSTRIIDNFDLYEENARQRSSHAFYRDPLLEVIFKTSYQVSSFFCHLRHRTEAAHLGGRQFKMLEEQLFSLV